MHYEQAAVGLATEVSADPIVRRNLTLIQPIMQRRQAENVAGALAEILAPMFAR